MCGIVYAHDFRGKAVNNGVLDQFDRQRGRGVRGFGLFDGQEGNIVRATTEDKILKWLCKYDSSLILFHHRLPTSTDNTKSTAHPFSTKNHFGKTQYIMVHNGVMGNSWTLKQEHEKLGIKYASEQNDGRFNDSEALLWDLALYLEGKQDKLKSIGSMAFIVIKLTKGKLDKMYFGRNNNPLKLFRVKQGVMLSSEGIGDEIESDRLYTWNYELKRLTDKKLKMPAYVTYESNYQPNNYYEPRYDYEEEEDYETYPDYNQWYQKNFEAIPSGEVEELALRYLVSQKGKFLIAYTELEFEYQSLLEQDYSPAVERQVRLYERAMSYLETDPEWLADTSVSSMMFEEPKQLELTEGVKK